MGGVPPHHVGHRLEDHLGRAGLGLRRHHRAHACGRGPLQLVEGGVDALVEIEPRRFHAVGARGVGGPGKAARGGGPRFHEHRAVGHEPAGGEEVGPLDEGAVEAAPAGLVGDRGIVEAVAEHHRPARKRRLDDFGDHLGAGRFVDEELRLVAEPFGLRVEHDAAQGLAGFGAARLAHADHLDPLGAQGVGKEADMGRLARPVAAFECDECAACARRAVNLFHAFAALFSRVRILSV